MVVQFSKPNASVAHRSRSEIGGLSADVAGDAENAGRKPVRVSPPTLPEFQRLGCSAKAGPLEQRCGAAQFAESFSPRVACPATLAADVTVRPHANDASQE